MIFFILLEKCSSALSAHTIENATLSAIIMLTEVLAGNNHKKIFTRNKSNKINDFFGLWKKNAHISIWFEFYEWKPKSVTMNEIRMNYFLFFDVEKITTWVLSLTTSTHGHIICCKLVNIVWRERSKDYEFR